MSKGRIAPQSLEYVRSHAPIVDIIQGFTSLKPSGKSHIGRCPFHKERTPSFHVNDRDGLFYCFGCQVGGDTIGFVQKMLNMEFQDSVEWVAEKIGYKIQYVSSSAPDHDPLEPLRKANQVACAFFQRELETHKIAKDQLEKRGVSAEAVEMFKLGYAPDSWDALRKELERNQVTSDQGVAAGVLIPSNKGAPYARFRDRLMIPVTDRRGNVVAFGGRIMTAEKTATSPKYLNSPETAIFHKGEIFFGAPHWEQAVLQKKEIVIVEGYFDVISLWMFGVKHAVAVMGLGLTPQHVKWLKDRQLSVVIMLDGDEAGERASRRLLPLFLNENVLAREVRLPEGEDPDTYAQKIGAEELTRVVDRAPLHLDATIERIFRTHQGTVEGEIEATRMVMTVLNHFSDVTAREIRMKHIADRLGVSLGSLRDVGRGAKPQVKSVSGSVSGPKNSSVSGSASGSKSSSVSASGSKPAAPVKQPEVLTSIWDERLLQLIVQFPRRLSYPTLSSAVDILSSERVRRAVEELVTLFSEYGFDAADSPVEERERDFLNLIKEKWSEEPRRLHWLARVRMHEEIKEPEGAEDREWEDCIARLREDKYRKESRQAQFTMKNLHPERHWDEVADLMKKQLKRAQERLGMKEVP